MNKILPLLKLELYSLYGINKTLHTKDKKAKNRYLWLGIAFAFIIILMLGYVVSLVYGLCFLGLSSIVPAYLTVLCSVIILFFGLFSAGNRIFGQKGYDILASMPINLKSIVISRFLSLYITDLILTAGIMLSGLAVYGFLMRPNLSFYIYAVIGTLFVPAIPLVISTVLGTVVFAVSSRMKNKSLAQTVLMVLLVLGGMLTSFTAGNESENFTVEQLTSLAQGIGDALRQIYPPSVWLSNGILNGNALTLLLFVIISVLFVSLTVLIVSLNFRSILLRLRNFTAKHSYKIGKMESRSILKALYVREAKRYFSSSIYVTNTILGPILGTVVSVAIAVFGTDKIKSVIPLEFDVLSVLPFFISAVFCLMTTTSISISMEGKQFWIVKSLPIPTRTLLDSKILLNLTLMIPCFAVSVTALAIGLKPSLSELLWLTVIPLLLMVFACVLGITVNLKFNSFDWEKEEQIVKQSLSAFLGGFTVPLLSIASGGLMLLIPSEYSTVGKTVFCLALLDAIILLYKRNNKKIL